jgi:hypothetical protein
VPAAHPQTGDVLDRALTAARAQAPPQGAKGFFHAVAGTKSPINRQSSRIAKPFASNQFLGGGNTPTVATPEQQAFLALPQAKKGNAQATKIEQNYVKAADTQTTTPARTVKGARGSGSSVQGAALTAPNINAVLQRGLGVVGAGVPIGSAAQPFISALQKAGLDPNAKQQVIAGFSKDATLQQPGVAGSLAAAAIARGNSLPAHPTSRQLLTAALSDKKPSYWDIISNLPKDALYTPVYAAEGGYALGHASRAALPTGLGGQGNTSELKAIGNQQLQQFEHPGAFVQQHPFQAALMAIGAAKGVGGLAGKVAKLPETARDVTLSNYPLSPISRGTLDQNLTTRLAQKTIDAILSKGPERFQANALKNRVVGAQSRIVRERAMEDRKVYTEYKNAGKRINPREKQFLLQNAAQGITPAEREAFYKSLGETPSRSAQANLANAQGERFGNGPLTAKQQGFVDAARKVAQHRTQTLKDAGDLSDEAALRNDYQTLTHVRASQGDPTASNILNVERHMQINALNKDIAGKQIKAAAEEAAGKPSHFTQRELGQLIQRRGALQNEIKTPIADSSTQALDAQHEALVRQFATEQGADPFRVGKEKPKVKSQFNYPGRAVRANANIPIAGIGKTRTFGDQLRSGNFEQNNRTFERQLFEPNTRADARRFVSEIGNPDSGTGAYPAENGRSLTDVEKANYTLLNRDNLRTAPKNANDTINASAATNKEAEIVRASRDLSQAWEQPGLDRVPDHGDFVLVPNPVKAQVDSQVARVRPGSAAHRFEQGTHAFKTGVLMTRPTYPLSNLVQGVGQGAIVGTGPLSWMRAIRGTLPTLPGTEDAGFIAREFGHSASQTARGFLDEGRPIRALAQATIGNYVKGIRYASIAVDNVARKATANKLAVGEAKKLAGWGKFHSTFGRVNNELIDLIQKMADGDTPETRAAAERVIKGMNEVQGDYGAMRSNVALDFAIPFHRWTRFITKLTLKTLPLKYPGRTLGIYQLGQLGQQGANQQGVLPQYLQEPLNIAGSATNRLTASSARINSLASLGTTFEPTTTGGLDYNGAISQLSPYFSIGYGAVSGKNLQTGTALKNAEGKPITSLADRARFLGNQVTGFVPPLGALAGGATGKPATSIPLPGLVQHLPASKTQAPKPVGPTVDLPLVGKVPLLPLINQVSPVRFDVRNQTADQIAGFKKFASALRTQFKAEIKREAKTPADVARITKKYEAIGAKASAKQAYFEKNPKALDALLASGTETH